jgi:hypothetical protein
VVFSTHQVARTTAHRKEPEVTIRTPISIAAIALALAAPVAASAAHGHHGKPAEVRSTRGSNDTPTTSYIEISTNPPTYVNVNACQLTGGCVGVPDPDTAGS